MKVSMIRRYLTSIYLHCKWQIANRCSHIGQKYLLIFKPNFLLPNQVQCVVKLAFAGQGQIYCVNSKEHIFILYTHTQQPGSKRRHAGAAMNDVRMSLDHNGSVCFVGLGVSRPATVCFCRGIMIDQMIHLSSFL